MIAGIAMALILLGAEILHVLEECGYDRRVGR